MNFTKILIDWYKVNKRDLPWRKTKDPYKIWLSEIILQQTQVRQGLPYYYAFTEAFETVKDLAQANENEVLKLWQGLGYYSRARNLHFSAQYITNELHGVFPNSYKDLLKLKGVGDYTASAIASICFNEVTAVVDGNVYRALSRYYGIETPINSTKGIKEFKQLAQELIDKEDPATFNQSIMEFGARQCKPKRPDCGICPLSTSCIALNNNKIDALPVKLKANKAKKKFFNYIVILSDNNKTIIEQREGKGIWQNLYQFPLIETEKSCNVSEIRDQLSQLSNLKNQTLDVQLYNDKDVIHKLSHQHLHTKFWIVSIDVSLKNAIPIEKIHEFPVPILIANFIRDFNL